MSNERVIERVRKMLALANDAAASEGERENAMRMAYATLAKHNLDLADVGSNQNQEVREQQVARMSVYPWARGIAHSLAGLFFCSYYYSRGSGKLANHYFVGKQSNAITANELAQYVISSVFKELRARFGGETTPNARAFAMGVEAAIRRRCHEMRHAAERAQQEEAQAQREQNAAEGVIALGHNGAQRATGTAVALANLYASEQKANADWIAANVGDLRTEKDRTKDVRVGAFAQGVQHGKTISLTKQVGAAKSNTLKLGK